MCMKVQQPLIITVQRNVIDLIGYSKETKLALHQQLVSNMPTELCHKLGQTAIQCHTSLLGAKEW